MRYDSTIPFGSREVSWDTPTYFIADIAANHDGQLERAKSLIWLAKEAGADAVKFQHFLAKQIVSDFGFSTLEGSQSHQSNWKKSVYQMYQGAECKREWTEELVAVAKKADIEFMTTPYDVDILHAIDPYVNVYKIGSGDITWIDFLKTVAQQNKPVLLATGAATEQDVQRAMDAILPLNRQVILMQCNTNYTASQDNFNYINLNVLNRYRELYPNMVLGLSDHTPGDSTVLGAVCLGARVIEKHFTDDTQREGPDHKFAMDPAAWRRMVNRTRELEAAMGDGIKRIEKNERNTVVVQRRCVRCKCDLSAGKPVTDDSVECLRPAPESSILPYQWEKYRQKTLVADKQAGDALYPSDFQE